ncbi:JmjC domain-containing protein [Arenicella xantha]|uniref:Cupin superfamily protein n=1 Tax=Arenicella xantha TaxID=644221 RepID=A0A395JI87_9GAMM|nr:cupin domain-containing protein [Arenicella xantha]RBP49796.1 cupin superfamily protein [Arenicella xantha]
MLRLNAALSPLTPDDLVTHYREGKCLVLEGAADKFAELISPLDIERRLNDGCNASVFPQTIKDGTRRASVDANCTWSPASLKKSDFILELEAGHSFMLANASQVTQALSQLCDELELLFEEDQVHADVHLYVSTDERGNSYDAHRDLPQHKLLLQVCGTANWEIYEPKQELPANVIAIPADQHDDTLTLVSSFALKQGHLLYMPPGVFHRVKSVEGARISVSIPFYSMPDANKMDRRHIPFASFFENAERATKAAPSKG